MPVVSGLQNTLLLSLVVDQNSLRTNSFDPSVLPLSRVRLIKATRMEKWWNKRPILHSQNGKIKSTCEQLMAERWRIKAWILPQWASFSTTLRWLALRSYETRGWPWRLERRIFCGSAPSLAVLLLSCVLPQKNRISPLTPRAKSSDPFCQKSYRVIISCHEALSASAEILQILPTWNQFFLFHTELPELSRSAIQLCFCILQLCFLGPLVDRMQLQVTQTESRDWLKAEPLQSSEPLQPQPVC